MPFADAQVVPKSEVGMRLGVARIQLGGAAEELAGPGEVAVVGAAICVWKLKISRRASRSMPTYPERTESGSFFVPAASVGNNGLVVPWRGAVLHASGSWLQPEKTGEPFIRCG